MTKPKIFLCRICGLHYENEKLVIACQEFCGKYNACSLEITKHSVESQAIKVSDEN